jgi:hypothetical protein
MTYLNNVPFLTTLADNEFLEFQSKKLYVSKEGPKSTCSNPINQNYECGFSKISGEKGMGGGNTSRFKNCALLRIVPCS